MANKVSLVAGALVAASLLSAVGVAVADQAGATQSFRSANTAISAVSELPQERIHLQPYVYFVGSEQYLGVNGSPTDLSTMTPIDVQLVKDGQTVASETGGARADGTVYLDQDFDLGQWNTGNAVPGTNFQVIAVDGGNTEHELGDISATLPMPYIGAITGTYKSTHYGHSPFMFRRTVTVNPVRIDNVPAGTPITVTIGAPDTSRAYQTSVDATTWSTAVVTRGPSTTYFGAQVSVSVDGTQVSRVATDINATTEY